MIGKLTGTFEVIEKGEIVLSTISGVGYSVNTAERYIREWSTSEEITLYIYTHSREDALLLYGFIDKSDMLLFRLLLTVQGIGPKLSMTIVGNLSSQEFLIGFRSRDKTRFSGISGLGKKTIERLWLDLESKIEEVLGEYCTVGSKSSTGSTTEQESIAGLVSLGFNRHKVIEKVRLILDGDNSLDTKSVITQTLKSLSGRKN